MRVEGAHPCASVHTLGTLVLALDSSSTVLAAALLRDGMPLAEMSMQAARPRGESLLPAIDTLVAAAGVGLKDVNLVAVATGPGSFNGIRGGIATAQGLGMALGVPVLGVPTLDALAYQHVGRADVVCALLAAGRGQFYAASYAGTWQQWQRLGEYAIAQPEAILDNLPAGTLLCGAVAAAAEFARDAEQRGLVIAPPVASFVRAAYVGALALARRDGDGPQFDLTASLLPVYLRRPGITRPSPARSLDI